MTGADPREIAKSDCVVLWGTNAVVTQINVMTHAMRARKERGAQLVVVDVYDNAHDEAGRREADPAARHGRRAGLRGHARPLPRRASPTAPISPATPTSPEALEAHLATRTPEWAAAIYGIPVGRDRGLRAALSAATKRTFFRLGYGFARSRNGAANMHAVSLPPAGDSALAVRGRRRAPFQLAACSAGDKTLIEGLDVRDPTVRQLDQSRIGADPDRRRRGAVRTGRRSRRCSSRTPTRSRSRPTRRWSSAASRARTCSPWCTSSS